MEMTIPKNVVDKEKFDDIIDQLIVYGEKTDEMILWKGIFMDLSDEQQKEIFEICEKELEKLKEIE